MKRKEPGAAVGDGVGIAGRAVPTSTAPNAATIDPAPALRDHYVCAAMRWVPLLDGRHFYDSCDDVSGGDEESDGSEGSSPASALPSTTPSPRTSI